MKQVIECPSPPGPFGWATRLFAVFVHRYRAHRRGHADLLSDHMLRDLGLHNMPDEARGDPLYGNVRRRW
ncbi:MAG TPA: hypothetical protein VG742_24120 [Dongiaceae bacterium]|nr:hypothetical protein [Dongiaceae bacterium]